MIIINPKDQSEKEIYRLLTSTIIPRPIALVTTQSTDGVINGAPFSYFNIVSAKPPMISISVQRKENGTMKDTAKNIYETQEFVVHIADDDNIEQFNAAAANLPSGESELAFANMTPAQSEIVSVPGVQEAKVRMECKLVKGIPLGGSNDETPACDLFIGEVVFVHIDEKIYDHSHIKIREFNPICRLAGSNYATIGNIFFMERPR
ncbi:MAG: flavin reductase family protein [Bacilli bacterium]|jgi:flavin reductase (DIM6/NTAB) family NADH-FMN oxidoreductase RutF|uniref:Flavin reductase family protein n=2 Tax=Ureibacillus TaxID=160795 RepID=A0ABW0RDJ8_9BACL|nr:hypothetical protein [Bacilli bacterium]